MIAQANTPAPGPPASRGAAQILGRGGPARVTRLSARFSREVRAPSVGRGQGRDRFGYRSAKALERRALATTHRAALPNENLLKTELAVASRAAWQALETRHAPQTQ